MTKYVIAKHALLLMTLLVSLSAANYSQGCGVVIEPSVADSETVVKGASATAVNNKGRRSHQSVFRRGLPYFSNLADGDYRITVKKAGFKQTIDTMSVSCDEAENGIVTTYVSLWPGRSSLSVDLTKKPMRLDRLTVIGNADNATIRGSDVDSGAPIDPPNPVTQPARSPKTVMGGVLNGKATSLPKPAYPPAARAVGARGAVSVQVIIDEVGNVISAAAVSGHPLLRDTAVSAARRATFSPTLLSGTPVMVSGIITYNFVP